MGNYSRTYLGYISVKYWPILILSAHAKYHHKLLGVFSRKVQISLPCLNIHFLPYYTVLFLHETVNGIG